MNSCLSPAPCQADDPRRRLPIVAAAALLLWSSFLCGLGGLLRQTAYSPEAAPLDAQILMEEPKEKEAPPKELPKPTPPKPRLVLREQPRPVPQAPPKQAPEPVKAADQPAAPAPAREISIPDASPASDAGTGPSLPAANPSAPGGTGSPFGPRAVSRAPTGPGSASGVQTTLPGFGAAYLNNPKPAYPALARKMGIEGRVTLKVFVSKDGKPLHIEVAESSGYDLLDKAAFDAVKNWRFVPARKGDAPYDEWVQVPIAFKLNR